jgi:UDP-3-O-[3-hydroxymyristoyl] glucosamine N-acyltransferase
MASTANRIGSPGWETAPLEFLEKAADEFDIAELRNEAAVGRVRQTGFAHTRRDGVICLAMNREYLAQAIDNPCICAIIAPPAVVGAEGVPTDKALVVTPRAEELYLYLHAEQRPDPEENVLDIHPSAIVDASAMLRGRVQVGARVSIGPRVVITGPATVGAGACLDAGVIVGCDGLYAKTVRGRRLHIPHFGGVDIGEDAYLHAGAIVARSALRNEVTRIGRAAHLGIMANVGHDSEIGDAATLSSHCVIAGRARIGAKAWIGASAVVSNAVRVGEGARVRLGAMVIRDVPGGASVSGNFAVDHARTLRRYIEDAGP